MSKSPLKEAQDYIEEEDDELEEEEDNEEEDKNSPRPRPEDEDRRNFGGQKSDNIKDPQK